MSPSGDIPAKDPDHSSVLCVHAGPQAGRLPVALLAHPHGRSGSCSGAVLFDIFMGKVGKGVNYQYKVHLPG